MQIKSYKSTLSIYDTTDILIIGGGMGAISAAYKLSEQGEKVIIIEDKTFLGREISSFLRPWEFSITELPIFLKPIFKTCSEGYNQVLNLNLLKQELEELLVSVGVKIIYMSWPIGIVKQRDRLRGLIIGNKFGRQVILAEKIIDTSNHAFVANELGIPVKEREFTEYKALFTLEFKDVKQENLEIKPYTGIKLKIHPGYGRPGHLYLECSLALNKKINGEMNLKNQVLKKSKQVAEDLLAHHNDFEKAALVGSSYEIAYVDFKKVIAKPSTLKGSFIYDNKEFNLASFTFDDPYLYILGTAADLECEKAELMLNPVCSALAGVLLGLEIAELDFDNRGLDALTVYFNQQDMIDGLKDNQPEETYQIAEQNSPCPGKVYPQMEIDEQILTVLEKADVVVVGGGPVVLVQP